MDPLALTAEALREPWRLWTGHLAHFGWEHALANALALAVPILLAPRHDRARVLGSLLALAPTLSLLLLPGLGTGQYRGASGLACALWGMVGLRLAGRRESTPLGLLMLAGLLLKLGAEAALGSCFLIRAEGWQSLPAAHLWGTLLGLAFALPAKRALRPA
jgi:rhomboid family GlyGly-CTERM serine protease